jgi:4-oxalocrotonate tautomerase
MSETHSEKETVMPLIQVKAIEGVFSPEKKQEIVKKLTDTMVAIEGEALRPYTVVLIEEIASGSWAVGGTAFTTEGVKELAASAK